VSYYIILLPGVCRYLDYEKLGIKTYSLSQYEDAFQALKEGTIAKAMFKLEK
jgi:hypothetical protein